MGVPIGETGLLPSPRAYRRQTQGTSRFRLSSAERFYRVKHVTHAVAHNTLLKFCPPSLSGDPDIFSPSPIPLRLTQKRSISAELASRLEQDYIIMPADELPVLKDDLTVSHISHVEDAVTETMENNDSTVEFPHVPSPGRVQRAIADYTNLDAQVRSYRSLPTTQSPTTRNAAIRPLLLPAIQHAQETRTRIPVPSTQNTGIGGRARLTLVNRSSPLSYRHSRSPSDKLVAQLDQLHDQSPGATSPSITINNRGSRVFRSSTPIPLVLSSPDRERFADIPIRATAAPKEIGLENTSTGYMDEENVFGGAGTSTASTNTFGGFGGYLDEDDNDDGGVKLSFSMTASEGQEQTSADNSLGASLDDHDENENRQDGQNDKDSQDGQGGQYDENDEDEGAEEDGDHSEDGSDADEDDEDDEDEEDDNEEEGSVAEDASDIGEEGSEQECSIAGESVNYSDDSEGGEVEYEDDVDSQDGFFSAQDDRPTNGMTLTEDTDAFELIMGRKRGDGSPLPKFTTKESGGKVPQKSWRHPLRTSSLPASPMAPQFGDDSGDEQPPLAFGRAPSPVVDDSSPALLSTFEGSQASAWNQGVAEAQATLAAHGVAPADLPTMPAAGAPTEEKKKKKKSKFEKFKDIVFPKTIHSPTSARTLAIIPPPKTSPPQPRISRLDGMPIYPKGWKGPKPTYH